MKFPLLQNKFPSLLILLLIAVQLIQPTHAQKLKFQRIGIEQGLSQSSAMNFLQDSRGFLWVGTWDGLNRYDGYSFVQFRNDPLDSTSLSGNSINALFEDRDGNIWVGTATDGVCYYDRKTEKFQRIKYDNSKQNLSGNHSIYHIVQANDGVIWIEGDVGLQRVNMKYKRMELVIPGTALGLNSCGVDAEKNLLFLILSELKILSPNGSIRSYPFSVKKYDGRVGVYPSSIYIDKNNRIWILTIGGGVLEFDRMKKEFVGRFRESKSFNGLSSNNISSMLIDSRGTMWIGTDKGLNKGINDSKTGQIIGFEKIYSNPDEETSLSSNSIFKIYEDRSGILWIGTNVGICKLVPERKKFINIAEELQATVNFNTIYPTAIREENGNVWIGTMKNLFRCERKSKTWKEFSNANSGLSAEGVFAFCVDHKKRMWVGTRLGLNLYNPSTQKFSPIFFEKGTYAYSVKNKIYAVDEDHYGNLWLGTESGLVKFNYDTKEYRRIYFDSSVYGKPLCHVLSLYADKDTLWVGMNNQGIVKYNIRTSQKVRFKSEAGRSSALSSNKILCITKDSHGSLWFGTLGGGINKLVDEQNGGTFVSYQKKNGLPNDYVYGILEDENGNLWLSTNYGISKFNPDTKKIRNFSMLDGLPANEYNQSSYYKAKNGKLFFGGIGGIVEFFPSQIEDNPIPPQIAVTEFKIFNQANNEKLTEKVIHLAYNQNFFSFEFTSLSFETPENNQYAYKLDGAQKDWTYSGTRRFASFTNIDPGEYTFRVKGTNNDGVWNTTGASIKIIISPPWWGTVWFRMLLIFGFTGSISGGAWFASRKKLQRKIDELEKQKMILEERQRTRDRIAKDLHDDLAATVGSAGLFLETAKKKMVENSEQTKNYLEKTGSLLSEAEEAISDIVWSVSPKNDTMQSLVTRIRLTTAELCEAQGIENEIQILGDVAALPLHDDVRRSFFLIYKEAVNNALKHASAKKIKVKFGIESNSLRLEVTDDGNGFQMKATVPLKGGNGIENILKRAKEIGAEVSITSEPGKGTSIQLVKQITQLSY